MSFETWISFCLLWLAFAVFPGPNAAYAVAVTGRHGRRAIWAAAGGFAAAVSVYVTLVAAGLLALLAASAEIFMMLKWLGVAYLAYLAWKFWTADPNLPGASAQTPAQTGARRQIALRAALISLTNPKSAMAYVMLYPAFMSTGAEAQGQLLVLGLTSVAISFLVYSAYGLLGSFGHGLIRNRRTAIASNRIFAVLFAGAAGALAVTQRR
ncbi:MAG TPA: LysE family translocator [Kiloniellales bacterium]